jgi:predicted PurR-regulated permease PerM
LSHIAGGLTSALSSIGSAFAPLFVGLIIAYILSPTVELIDNKILTRVFFKMPEDPIKYERRKKLRFLVSVIITFILVAAVICLIIYGFAILLLGQFVFTGLPQMVEDMINYFTTYQAAASEWAASLPQDAVGDKINEVISAVANWFTNSFNTSSIIGFLSNIVGGVINLVIGIVISVYLLKDKSFFLSLCRKVLHLLLPQKTNAIVRETLHEINKVFSQFIRGALLDALIIAVLASIILSVAGVQFAVFIGCFAGIANIIPYFGALLGMIPAFIVAVFTEGIMQGLVAVGLLFVLQQFDASYIYPKIVGSTIGLHPLFVLLAITVAGYYGGILGMVIAVPVAGIIKVFVLRLAYWLDDKKSLKT